MTEKFIQALKTGEATVVDVRTPMEFMGGHATGSINIPLYEIEERIEELRKMKTLCFVVPVETEAEWLQNSCSQSIFLVTMPAHGWMSTISRSLKGSSKTIHRN